MTSVYKCISVYICNVYIMYTLHNVYITYVMYTLCMMFILTFRYKTELCRTFVETGRCNYNTKCQFAHGAQDMRSLLHHPKYKTELCRAFHTVGLCQYGPRCHYVHSTGAGEAQVGGVSKQRRDRTGEDSHHGSSLSPMSRPDSSPEVMSPRFFPRRFEVINMEAFNDALSSFCCWNVSMPGHALVRSVCTSVWILSRLQFIVISSGAHVE